MPVGARPRRGSVRPVPGPSDTGPVASTWTVVAGLSVIVTASYGVLMYAFPVLLGAMQADLGWSLPMLTGGYSLAALVAGLAAIPVGRWLDRAGASRVIGLGSVVAPVLLVFWSRVESPWAYYGIWAGLGVCMAALSYEPAFAELVRVCRAKRARALTALTMSGGLASVIFVPLTAELLRISGWRYTVLWLAAIFTVLTVVPYALAFGARPGGLGRGAVRPHAELHGGRRFADAVASPGFLRIAVAFALSTLVNAALAVHLIPILLERGHSLGRASTALAFAGLMKVAGRFAFGRAAERFSATTVFAGSLLVQAVGIAMLFMRGELGGVAAAVVLWGAAEGVAAPARAAIVAEAFGVGRYGSIQGALSTLLAGSRAIAPIGASAIRVWTGGYAAMLALAAGATLLAWWAVRPGSVASFRAGPRLQGREPSTSTESPA